MSTTALTKGCLGVGIVDAFPCPIPSSTRKSWESRKRLRPVDHCQGHGVEGAAALVKVYICPMLPETIRWIGWMGWDERPVLLVLGGRRARLREDRCGLGCSACMCTKARRQSNARELVGVSVWSTPCGTPISDQQRGVFSEETTLTVAVCRFPL
ncbi:hypothetical protein AXG93_3818s1020 [Marchantia polymorpha subsp. ruderalis]|uniref:Uncharacterized protein n=1 Tax=Marchantia polymorpha subsp. ruderalis TaxID=1480154 RepID=A0A176VJJ3_MARPO|nr:hypothetical protein AXG93_3818s1020 [Marchantia polymorpha subsp. ruderalis]